MVLYSSRLSHDLNENRYHSHNDHNFHNSSGRHFAAFVEEVFIPQHVTHKTFAGRVHYCAILKHVLHPETVDRLFGQHHAGGNAKLRAIPGWPYMDDLPLESVTPAHITRVILAAFAQGYSAQTVKHIRNVIGAIMSHALNDNYIRGNNPVSSVPLPPIVRKRAQHLDADQIRSILKLMRYPEREMTLVTIGTGMSISEICGLQWKHVNLTSTNMEYDREFIPPRCILVRQQWNARGLAEIQPGRGRLVPIPDALANTLSILKAQQRNSHPEAFVLTSESGSPISAATVRDTVLKPLGRRLNMPWLSWQVIRRTHASFMTELRTKISHDLVVNHG